MFEDLVSRVEAGTRFSPDEIPQIIAAIVSGLMTDEQTAAFRRSVFSPGVTDEELTAVIKTLREGCVPIKPTASGDLTDVCGAGGGTAGFNNSIAAAIIAAAGGARIAKNVLRSIPGRPGSAEILAALGINIELTAEQAAQLIDEVGIAFFSVTDFNPAIDMMLPPDTAPEEHAFFRAHGGALINPAFPTRALVGVLDKEAISTVTTVALGSGIMNGFIVNGEGGYDEFSMVGPSSVTEIASGRPTSYDTKPEDSAIDPCSPDDIKTGSVREAVFAIKSILSGKLKGPRREAVALNGAAALMAAGKAGYFARGLLAARNLIDDGSAAKKLEELRKKSNEFK